MNPFTLKLILENSKTMDLMPGTGLYEEGSNALNFYIVLGGWIAIDGPQGSCGEYGVGSIVGEEWLYSKSFRGRQYRAFCPVPENSSNLGSGEGALLIEISLKQF